jgi:hypothetical protein
VTAYPEPQNAIRNIDPQGSEKKADAHRTKPANFLEMQRGVVRVVFKQGKAFIGKVLDPFGKELVTGPEVRGGEVFHIS